MNKEMFELCNWVIKTTKSAGADNCKVYISKNRFVNLENREHKLQTVKEIEKVIKSGELGNIELLAGKGFNRWSQFTNDQMFTFITMRALAASPLMMGGDLPSLDDFSLGLITHPEVLECNQNGIMGSLIFENEKIEVWKTPKNNGTKEGWIGLFNRNSEPVHTMCSEEILGIDPAAYKLNSIWNDTKVPNNKGLTIPANGVVFIKYWS